MATKKRLIDASAFHLRVGKKKMSEVFPNWKELPKEVQDAVCKHGQHMEMLLKTQSTVDAMEVVHAQWDEWWPGDCALIMTGEEMLYQCSACTAKYDNVEGFRYCPHCGAFMDLEVSDDE